MLKFDPKILGFGALTPKNWNLEALNGKNEKTYQGIFLNYEKKDNNSDQTGILQSAPSINLIKNKWKMDRKCPPNAPKWNFEAIIGTNEKKPAGDFPKLWKKR